MLSKSLRLITAILFVMQLPVVSIGGVVFYAETGGKGIVEVRSDSGGTHIRGFSTSAANLEKVQPVNELRLDGVKPWRAISTNDGMSILLGVTGCTNERSRVLAFDSELSSKYEVELPIDCGFRLAPDIECFFFDSPAVGAPPQFMSVAAGSVEYDLAHAKRYDAGMSSFAYVGDLGVVVVNQVAGDNVEVSMVGLDDYADRWVVDLPVSGRVTWSSNSIVSFGDKVLVAVAGNDRRLHLFALQKSDGSVVASSSLDSRFDPVVVAVEGEPYIAVVAPSKIGFFSASDLTPHSLILPERGYSPSGPHWIQTQDEPGLYRIVGSYTVFEGGSGRGGVSSWGGVELDLGRAGVRGVKNYANISDFRTGGAGYGLVR